MDMTPDPASSRRSAPQAQPPSFADRIKLLIKACGSVTQIARTCGFSEGVVRSWRDGRSDPSRERCLALARGLGVSLVWLIAGEGAMWEDAEAAATITSREVSAETGANKLRSDDTKRMDTARLSAAVRTLQSTLELSGSGLNVPDTPDLLGEMYALMAQDDPLRHAEGMTRIHSKIAERARRERSKR